MRRKRWLNVAVVNLRILIGFAFVPAGLKKVLDQPFTDPDNTGVFHEFLHAFYATGVFYQFFGAVQLTMAVLLMTQTFATLGALMALPVTATITVFCWSTGVVPTATVATLMLLGTVALVVWDADRWRDIVAAPRAREPELELPIDLGVWRLCGAGILALYGATCAISGGIYRPKGMDLDNPAFYVFPVIALFPVVTLAIEQRRRARPTLRRAGAHRAGR
jgi:uncharacterized membrane protein YphA (DoxX/SURF4 family)